MELIAEMQGAGALWAINTGRSVELLESGLLDFEFPIRPDFILTSERDVFRPSAERRRRLGTVRRLERTLRARAQRSFNSAKSVLAEVVDFVSQKTKARLIYHAQGLEGLVAANEAELDHITQFIDKARAKEPKFHYQRNTIYLRFCHADYHKGAALGRTVAAARDFARTRFLPRAITTTISRCSTAGWRNIPPVRQTRSPK